MPLPGGARNAFPLAMARAVALREPGHSPFLLPGEKGTGQSHVLQHMAASLARQGLRVILAPMPSERGNPAPPPASGNCSPPN